jgi:hypothetical protein
MPVNSWDCLFFFSEKKERQTIFGQSTPKRHEHWKKIVRVQYLPLQTSNGTWTTMQTIETQPSHLYNICAHS